MPEYPDITVYAEALGRRIAGAVYRRSWLWHPFLLRTVAPQPAELEGRAVTGVRRIGKQIVIALEGELFMVLHLMIAGRLRWSDEPPKRQGLAAFEFSTGTLLLTEAGTKRRAALHLVRGEEELRHYDRGGVDPLSADLEAFLGALRRENHTLKRALTDPRLIAGVGNAYSDEILHAAKLSPFKTTSTLERAEADRLLDASRRLLLEWAQRLRDECHGDFPRKVTAFRPQMAVHGNFGAPCPTCGSQVQRIVYAENECNYCPTCQTGGKLLADRALSRLLREDWPATAEELDELRRPRP